MPPKQQEITELQEQLRDLEKLRKVLGNTLTDQKKAELEVRLKQLDTGGGAVVAGNVNTEGAPFIGRDINIYTGEDPAAKAQQVEADYRREVADHCGTLPLRGVDATAGSTTAEPLSLAHVYINLNDSEIGHATPVGMYLKGATPTGLYDAVGNVWEWTLSRYRTYPYDHQDDRNDPAAEG